MHGLAVIVAGNNMPKLSFTGSPQELITYLEYQVELQALQRYQDLEDLRWDNYFDR